MVSVLALAGFATYVLYPAVPPWMAAQQGHLAPVTRIIPWAWSHIRVFSFDTLFETGSKYANDVAAMPSLHAAYSLLVTLYLWRIARRWWWRALLVAYPLAMAFALVYCAEHLFIDVAIGWLYAVAVFAAVNRAADRWALRRERRRSPQSLPQVP
jgi:membrane-associated phospholipid phosphatase